MEFKVFVFIISYWSDSSKWCHIWSIIKWGRTSAWEMWHAGMWLVLDPSHLITKQFHWVLWSNHRVPRKVIPVFQTQRNEDMKNFIAPRSSEYVYNSSSFQKLVWWNFWNYSVTSLTFPSCLNFVQGLISSYVWRFGSDCTSAFGHWTQWLRIALSEGFSRCDASLPKDGSRAETSCSWKIRRETKSKQRRFS